MPIYSYDTANGRRWYVSYRKPDGRQSKKRGFKRKHDAEIWQSEHVTIPKADADFVDPSKGRIRVGYIYERYIATHRGLWKETHLRPVESFWRNHLEEDIADRAITSIRKSDIQQLVNDWASTMSPSMALRGFGIIKGIFATAKSDGIIRQTKAIEGMDLPHKPKRKENRHYLTAEQVVKLANHSGHYKPLVLLLGFCGLRHGEAAALRPDDIDLTQRRIHVRHNLDKFGNETTPKNYEIRDVPIPANLVPIIATVKHGVNPREHVFRDEDGHELRYRSVGKNSRGWWIRALKDSGLEPMTMHDLRHTAASIAIHAGANVKAVQRMLGHKSAAMTLDTYADLFDNDLDHAAEAINLEIPEIAVD